MKLSEKQRQQLDENAKKFYETSPYRRRKAFSPQLLRQLIGHRVLVMWDDVEQPQWCLAVDSYYSEGLYVVEPDGHTTHVYSPKQILEVDTDENGFKEFLKPGSTL